MFVNGRGAGVFVVLGVLGSALLAGCGSSADLGAIRADLPAALTEADFLVDPSLHLAAGQVAITFLEPYDAAPGNPSDTGAVGVDVIPLRIATAGPQAFGLDPADRTGSIAQAQLKQGETVLLTLTPASPTGSVPLATGDYSLVVTSGYSSPGSTSAGRVVFLYSPAATGVVGSTVDWMLSTRNCPGCNLSGARIGSADLEDGDLHGANLTLVFLGNARMDRVNLSGANLTLTELSGASLNGANLAGAAGTGVRLDLAQMRGASAEGATLRVAMLEGLDARNATFTRATLTGSRARMAWFAGADLTSADLTGSDLSMARMQGANLTSARLHLADVAFSELQGAILDQADLTNASFRSSNLTGGSVTGADLTGANFNEAVWVDGRVCTYPSVGVCGG